jgi:hypothetical protein
MCKYVCRPSISYQLPPKHFRRCVPSALHQHSQVSSSCHRNRHRHSAHEQLEQDADVNARSRFRLIVGPQSTIEPGHEKVDLAAHHRLIDRRRQQQRRQRGGGGGAHPVKFPWLNKERASVANTAPCAFTYHPARTDHQHSIDENVSPNGQKCPAPQTCSTSRPCPAPLERW